MTLRHLLAALTLAVLAAGPTAAQDLVVSEIDTQTPAPDASEFVELYNPGAADVDLSDYAVVLYDGATDAVYAAYDLDDFEAPASGYFVVCGDATLVDECDADLDAGDFLRTGPAAVALFRGRAVDFATGQAVTMPPAGATLVDALVYGPGADDTALITALGADDQYDEASTDSPMFVSLQRSPMPTSDDVLALLPSPGEDPTPAVVTDIDEARDLGPGATVTVEGIVTRAEGDFIFLQDGTAALLILVEDDMGEANDLREEVEAGTVAAGTVLNVTGTISERQKVLTIANDNLDRYVAGATDMVPAPQVVTLAQFAANGEAYESELIQVQGVSFGATGTFMAGQNYAISDGSGPATPVQFSLPEDDNTRIEGTPIPAGPVTLTGIGGQDRFLASAFRILGIDPEDVGGNATEPGNTGDPDVDLLISEVDPSQAGTDTGEFVELYNAEGTDVDLDGYALVFFSGSQDRSYEVVDLDGASIPAGGLLVVCGTASTVDGCDFVIPGVDLFLINGPAAVALYAGSDVNFPDGTLVSTTNLVDAVVYGTGADDAGLLTGLDVAEQVDEDANGMLNDESIQRLPIGSDTFVVAAPTPGAFPVLPPPEVTLAEARALGAGEAVTVEGVVTRTMGAFTYIQDATGGLSIRQTSGAFFDAVADGTIEPGTVVRVTGELSEFNSLLQINGSDLAEFEVVGTDDVPNPVLVTLAQLASNGEAFEGELVAVSGVTFEAEAGEPFEASTTYEISDASSATNAVSVRVPNASDTMIDGELVPEGPVTVIGVVGQFDGDDDGVEEGYQLLVIDIGDVNPDAVSNEAGPAEGLELALANPVRGASTVTFTTPATGPARLAVYDALGRRVAVLADGPVAAGAHTATLDAASMAPGVYVLRLEAEGGALTRTVTVVR